MGVPANLVERLKVDLKQHVTEEIQRLGQDGSRWLYIGDMRDALTPKLNNKLQHSMQREFRGVSLRAAVEEALHQIMPELGYRQSRMGSSEYVRTITNQKLPT